MPRRGIMVFDEHKIDVIRHEVGHWVLAKYLGFKTGDIEIEILENNKFHGHNGAAKIFPEPDINNLDTLYKYIDNRICILFAGVISQILEKNNSNERTAAILLETDGADDYKKIQELLFIARGVRFSGSIQESSELDHRNLIQKECWEKSDFLVKENKDLILFISKKIAQEIVLSNKCYLFKEERLNSWLSEAAA